MRGADGETQAQTLGSVAWRWRSSTAAVAVDRFAHSGAALPVLFATGFVLRLLIAPHVGFYEDLLRFRTWGGRLADAGPHRFYSAPGLAVDYPPAYLYVLYAVGKLSRAVGATVPTYLALKLPAIVGDLGLAWFAGALATRLRRSWDKDLARVLGASAVLFNPAVIALSAVWGQVDAIPAALILLSFLLLLARPHRLLRDIGGVMALSLALSMKPQSAFVVPAVAVAMVWPRAEGRSARRLVVMILCSVAIWVGTGLPFGLGPVALFRLYRFAASVYPITSVWAFNAWGAVGFWRPDVSSAQHSAWRLFGIPAVYAGGILFVVGAAVVVRRMWRYLAEDPDQLRPVLFGAAGLSMIGFAVMTRMHERYLFLSLACLAPFVCGRWLRWAYGLLSGAFLVNLYFPFVAYNVPWAASPATGVRALRVEPLYGWLYGGMVTDAWQKKVLSALTAGVCLSVALRGWRHLTDTRPTSPGSATSGSAVRRALVLWESGIDRIRRVRVPARTAVVDRRSVPLDDAPGGRPDAARALRGPRSTLARIVEQARPLVPAGIVAAVVMFNLVVLRGELRFASNLNDSAQHFQMLRWAVQQIHLGHLPLDGWYPFFALGSAAFHQYHTLPHVLTSYISLVTGVGAAYHWTLYLLLALWPICVWWTVRLFDYGKWHAAAAAVVAPLVVSAPGYGFEHGSYTWQGYGVWPQLWSMWLLPLAWALSWRAVHKRRGYAIAAFLVAVTIACHFIVGYLALICVGVWVWTTRGRALGRAMRAALVGAGAVVVASWVIVPLIADRRWSTKSIYYVQNLFADSYGAKRVLAWLFSGGLFDHGRLPVMTVLVVAGLVACIRHLRHDHRARALVGVFIVSMLLFFGRPTLGPLLKLLPGNEDLQIHRFIVGVHMSGILLAGVGAVSLYQLAVAGCRRVRIDRGWVTRAVLFALAVVYLLPGFIQVGAYDLRGSQLIAGQILADRTDGADAGSLVALAKARGGGRFYAGMRSGWGADYRIGYVPMYAELANHDADQIGFIFRMVNSLSTDIEANFNEANPDHYELYNVKYLILPEGRQPGTSAKVLARRGRHVLWETKARGYLDVVDTIEPIRADRANLGKQMAPFLGSDLAARHLYPTVAFGGAPASEPTTSSARHRNGSPGRVTEEADELADGRVSGRIVANRRAVVIARTTFHPRWRAYVDGERRAVQLVAPSFVGVPVPPGRHTVRFVYEPIGAYPVFFGAGALALVGLFFAFRHHRAEPS